LKYNFFSENRIKAGVGGMNIENGKVLLTKEKVLSVRANMDPLVDIYNLGHLN